MPWQGLKRQHSISAFRTPVMSPTLIWMASDTSIIKTSLERSVEFSCRLNGIRLAPEPSLVADLLGPLCSTLDIVEVTARTTMLRRKVCDPRWKLQELVSRSHPTAAAPRPLYTQDRQEADQDDRNPNASMSSRSNLRNIAGGTCAHNLAIGGRSPPEGWLRDR